MVSPNVPPAVKSTDRSMSPWARSPENVPAQPVESGTRLTVFWRNSKSMWLSPLFTTRSPPKKISLTETTPLASTRWPIAKTLLISSLFGVLPLPQVSPVRWSPLVSLPEPVYTVGSPVIAVALPPAVGGKAHVVWSTDSGSTMKSRAPAGTPAVGPTYAGACGGTVAPLKTPPSNRPFVPGQVCTPLTVVGWLQAAGLDAAPLAQSLLPAPLQRSA